METTTSTFEHDVIERSNTIPVLVDFWAPWCAPCRVLGPVLENLASRNAERFVLAKVNTEAEPDLAMRFAVRGIPDVKLVVRGKVVAQFTGALPEAAVESFLDEHLPSPSHLLVLDAQKSRESGDKNAAQRLYREALELDAGNKQARLGLADLVFSEQPEQALELIEPFHEGDEGFELADALRVLEALRQELQAAEGPDAEAQKNVDASETTKAGVRRYYEGISALGEGRFADAFEAWLDVLQTRTAVPGIGAKRACVALFHRLGDGADLVRQYRRKFSSVLY
jgi:putative thioredoxin